MALAGNSAVESDVASQLLIAELVLNDIAAVQATRKGKAREGAPRSDEDIAFDLQVRSLNAFTGVLRNYQFASSIDRAIESDAPQLAGLALLDQVECDDHRAAIFLGGGHDLPRQTVSQRMMERTLARSAREPASAHRRHASNATEADMRAIDLSMKNVHVSTTASESVRQSPKTVEKGFECVICGDDVVTSHSFKAPCAHYYCRGCIVSLVETSLRDETLHPLRCCHQPLPLLHGVFRFISISLRYKFLAKSQEYTIPVGSRIYCSNPRCSTFLGASGDRKRNLTCSNCDTISCSQCKDNAHPGEDCAEHQLTLELREMATANKWQTCPGCHAIVELSHGCYHITCRCSVQFCYLCSARWKTCNCRQWDEEQLLNDAERRVRNEFGNRAAEVQPAMHAERVHQRMEVLRENHECRAHFWRYRHGPGQCEECGGVLGVFLMRCIRCQALVCRRCSVNRL